MYNKFYILVFDPSRAGLAVELHKQIKACPYIGDWWHYIGSAYIIKSQYTLATIQDYLTKNTPESRQYLLVEVNLHNNNGWLPQEAWDWINTRK